mmetsp:Transcript_4698/g.10235  ORF Transcript_4698/g.10235 Transcript_4698/m.10235 type:complete len:548 (-) Transcript_4698:199-1842(-)
MRWYQVQPQGRARRPCEGHTVSVVDRCLYILFGKHEDEQGNVICPPLQVLDTRSMCLSHPQIEQAPDGRIAIPDDREGHTASVVGHKIYVFGGTWTDDEDNTIYMNDLHVLDVKTFTWSKPACSGTAPIEREGHTAAVVARKIFIFAGTWVDDDDNSNYLHDLLVLEVDSMSWSQPATTGERPSQREGHTASAVGSHMVIFGGAGLDKEDAAINLSDMHILDTISMSWSQPSITGAPPQERRYHTASVVGSTIYVFGGQYYDPKADLHFECDRVLCEFDSRSAAWAQRKINSQPPLRRACHSAGVVDKCVYIVGGRYWDMQEDDYIFLNDVQVLDTRPSSSLAADWRRYFNNKHLSDLELLVEGKLIPVHRVVLAARCSHFQRMFDSGMREATETQIEIADVGLEVFMTLLHYLYVDDVEIPSGLALPLFAVSDRFGVERLKQVCAATIESELSVETVCAALTVADQHNATELLEASVSFIVTHFADVHATDGFKDLSRSLLEVVHSAISARLFPTKDGNLGLSGVSVASAVSAASATKAAALPGSS